MSEYGKNEEFSRLERRASRRASRRAEETGAERPERAAGRGGRGPEAPDADAGGVGTPSSEGARRGFRLERYAGQVLSGNILTRAEVRRYYPYIFFMALLMLLYIANGYHIQTLHRRYDRLNDQVKELRSRSLTLSSIRMSATRQSEIVREVERRGIPLRESLEPPKVIEK